MNIKEKLEKNICSEQIKQLYATEEQNKYINRFLHLIETYCNVFHDDVEGVRLFSAPGRTEVGGNHTDHQKCSAGIRRH